MLRRQTLSKGDFLFQFIQTSLPFNSFSNYFVTYCSEKLDMKNKNNFFKLLFFFSEFDAEAAYRQKLRDQAEERSGEKVFASYVLPLYYYHIKITIYCSNL